LSLAAVNSTRQCVISGPGPAVKVFARELEEKGYQTRPLHTSHAFHSPLMDPILAEFRERVKAIKMNKPEIPYISNVTGSWLKTAEVLDPGYWSTHLRQTVRFARGLSELLKEPGAILVEVGPGKGLSALVKQHADLQPSHRVIHLLRHPHEDVPDRDFLYRQLGHLWLWGVDIDWVGFYPGEKRKRLALPTYCFDRKRYWLDGDPMQMGAAMLGAAYPLRKKADMADWFYVPSWERVLLQRSFNGAVQHPGSWLVLMDEAGLAKRLREGLEQQHLHPIMARTGPGFGKINEREFLLDPGESQHYDLLFREVPGLSKSLGPLFIVHLWGVTAGKQEEPGLDTFDKSQDTGLFSLLNLVQALGRAGITREVRIAVVTDHLQEVTGEEVLNPAKATLLGAVKIIPLEYPNIRCSSIDVVLPEPGDSNPHWHRLIQQLLEEVQWGFSQKVQLVAFRGTHRWQPVMKPYRLNQPGESTQTPQPPPRLKQDGVYLITGGLGGMGFTLAGDLAQRFSARLILVGRSPFPLRQEWDQWLGAHPGDTHLAPKIRKIREWERSGAQLMVCSADTANLEQMQDVVTRAEERFGQINGIIHTAGLADYEGVIQRRTREMTESVMAPKVKGTLVLEAIFKHKKPDFLVLFSSIGNVLYKVKFGQVGYNAANEFLDCYAAYKTARDGIRAVSINWCDWLEVGMSVEAVKKRLTRQGTPQGLDMDTMLYGAVTPTEGAQVFQRILNSRLVRAAVSTQDLNLLLEQLDKKHDEGSHAQEGKPGKSLSPPVHQRPHLSTEYAAPVTETEKILAAIWERFFGFEPLGRSDDFFELGGDSLQVMTVSTHIHKTLGVQIPLQVFFTNPTIGQLAGYIRECNPNEIPGAHTLEPVEEREYYPLGSAQKRIYILQQAQKESTGYNQPRVYTLEMEPERKTIEEIFGKLIERHESLRTLFLLIGEEPVQIIGKPGEIDFKVQYYERGRGEEVDDEWVRKMVRDFVKPFDMVKAPLFRARLIKVKENRTVLMVDLHHIISDGSSNGIFVREFIRLSQGDYLPPTKLQYKDFSQWQNRQKDEGEMKVQEEFWTGEFEADVPVLKLPTDYKRPETRDYEGNSLEFAIPVEAAEKLREYARDTDSTLFMVILALYNIFLAKLSGEEDIVTGTIVWGRKYPDLTGIIGMFVNTLALRNYPKGNKTFINFLKEIKKRVLQAFDNQDFQFEDLVDKLQLKRDTGRNPLFDVLFIHHSHHLSTPSSSSDALKPAGPDQSKENHEYQYEDNQTKFDLVLVSVDEGNRVDFAFGYSASLFKKETIQRFAGYFQEIIAAVTGPGNGGMLLEDLKISHELGEVQTEVYNNLAGQLEF
jgi:NAD(P)-dependent dehydrogenase (short-subunit alcohol dehydrogenase family)/acyl carrier protein